VTEGTRLLLRKLYDPGPQPKPSREEAIRLLAAIENEAATDERFALGRTFDTIESHEHPAGAQQGSWIRLAEVRRILQERDEIAAVLARP
jgi:hypothetical protein